jgi:6-pyruvoyltetrahydropterin/6-carboxytetrahydropterin synthase
MQSPLSAPSGSWRVVKTYGQEEGLSCCFRQYAATASHCRFLHGYALGFRFTLLARSLDARGWCFDFGGLKPLRAWLHEMFDHTVLVADDDPDLPRFRDLAAAGLMQLRELPATGCEAFALLAWSWADAFVARESGGRVRVERVEVSEHGGNSASYAPLNRD